MTTKGKHTWSTCPDCGGYSSEGHIGTERCRAYTQPSERTRDKQAASDLWHSLAEIEKLEQQRDELQLELARARVERGEMRKQRDELLERARQFVDSYKGKSHLLGNGKAMVAYAAFADIIDDIDKAEGRETIGKHADGTFCYHADKCPLAEGRAQ